MQLILGFVAMQLVVLGPCRAIRVHVAGSTTAQAAERLGLEKVYFPEAPGVEGFVDAIVEALKQNDRNKVLSAI